MSITTLLINSLEKSFSQGFTLYTPKAGDVGFVQYTSGSTSEPKGVLITHSNLMDNSEIIHHASQTDKDTILYSWLPPYHDMGLIAGIIQPIFIGGTSILLPTLDFIEKPSRWVLGLAKYQCTMTGGPNFAYELCASKTTLDVIKQLDLTSLKVAANGAEPITHKTMEHFYSTFAPAGLRKNSFLCCYGLAESTVMATAKIALDEDLFLTLDSDKLKQNMVVFGNSLNKSTVLVSSGKPLMALKIVHPEHLVECQELEIGEVWLQGKSVAKGYYNNAKATENTFHAHLSYDPTQEDYLRTGDLGFLYQGQLYICGRIKDMIIIRGKNYYPQDIELAVAQAHPKIRRGCSVAYPKRIADEEALVVVAELKDKTSKNSYTEIVHSINQVLGQKILLMPQEIHLVQAKSIPKTTSGKLQRTLCRESIESQKLIPLYTYDALYPR